MKSELSRLVIDDTYFPINLVKQTMMIMKFILFFLFTSFTIFSFGQSNNVFGGSYSDYINNAVFDSYTNLYTCGYTRSSDLLIDTVYGNQDAWLQKLDKNRNIIWSRAFGGSENDVFTDMMLINGKIFCVGYTSSDSGDIVFNHGMYDFWLAVIDTSGNLLFDSCYGGQQDQMAYSILQYSNSNLVISGYSDDTTGQVSVHLGGRDFWFIEIDTLGNLIREKSIGGPDNEYLYTSALLPNGDILLAGSTYNPGAAFDNYHGSSDAAVACLDSNWNSKWQNCYGEPSFDAIYDIYVKSIDTILFVGYSNSSTANSQGMADATIWQTNRTGAMIDIKFYGGGNNDNAQGIIQDTDSSYLLIGESQSHTGQLRQNFGMDDVFVFRVDLSLNLLEANNYGGTSTDKGVCILKYNDSTSCIIANSKSDDIQVPINYGQYDLWILDTVFSNNSTSNKSIESLSNHISIFPNPTIDKIHIISQSKSIGNVFIYGIQGTLIKEYKPNSKAVIIDVSMFSSGLYLLKIVLKKGSPLVRRIVIE